MADRTCSIEGCHRRLIARGWCVKHYQRWQSTGDPTLARVTRGPLEARFWAKVDRNGPIPPHTPKLGPCWLWTGCTFRGGYGQIWVGGAKRIDMAHRVAYRLEVGPIPDGQMLRHRCDTPLCVRPDHLAPGSGQDNVDDRQARGRSARGLWSGAYTHPESRLRGERKGRARLTEDQVRTIRNAPVRRGVVSMLAREMGVSRSTVARARDHDNRRHLT